MHKTNDSENIPSNHYPFTVDDLFKVTAHQNQVVKRAYDNYPETSIALT